VPRGKGNPDCPGIAKKSTQILVPGGCG